MPSVMHVPPPARSARTHRVASARCAAVAATGAPRQADGRVENSTSWS